MRYDTEIITFVVYNAKLKCYEVGFSYFWLTLVDVITKKMKKQYYPGIQFRLPSPPGQIFMGAKLFIGTAK